MGTSGRSSEMSRALNPDWVKATMALARSTRAAWQAASATASGKPYASAVRRRSTTRPWAARSARSAMRAMIWTASTG